MGWAAIAARMGQRKNILVGYSAWVAVLVLVYYAVPAARTESWGLLCLSGVSGIIAGLALNRPARKLPWVLLAAALTCFGAGQMSFLVAEQMGTALPFPSFADAFYLSCYPLAAAGLLGFVAARSPHGDRHAPDRRADADGGPGAAVMDVPDHALRARPVAGRAGSGRVDDRLPAG